MPWRVRRPPVGAVVLLLLLLVEVHKPRVAVIGGQRVGGRAVAATAVGVQRRWGGAADIDERVGKGCGVFGIGVQHASARG